MPAITIMFEGQEGDFEVSVRTPESVPITGVIFDKAKEVLLATAQKKIEPVEVNAIIDEMSGTLRTLKSGDIARPEYREIMLQGRLYTGHPGRWWKIIDVQPDSGRFHIDEKVTHGFRITSLNPDTNRQYSEFRKPGEDICIMIKNEVS